jgi:hypothetical protein
LGGAAGFVPTQPFFFAIPKRCSKIWRPCFSWPPASSRHFFRAFSSSPTFVRAKKSALNFSSRITRCGGSSSSVPLGFFPGVLPGFAGAGAGPPPRGFRARRGLGFFFSSGSASSSSSGDSSSAASSSSSSSGAFTSRMIFLQRLQRIFPFSSGSGSSSS